MLKGSLQKMLNRFVYLSLRNKNCWNDFTAAVRQTVVTLRRAASSTAVKQPQKCRQNRFRKIAEIENTHRVQTKPNKKQSIL